jgi:hypothetical protein
MRFPSFSTLLQQSVKTYIRFPFAILNAIIGTIAAILIFNMENRIYAPEVLNILLSALLGIPLLIALTLLCEKHHLSKKTNLLAQIIGIILLTMYGFSLPKDITIAPWHYIYQFFMLLTGMHLLVAIIPFTKKGETNGFWQYNKSLFINILIAALYSAVLYLGLTIALAALQHLFNVDVPPKRYGQLWALIAGIFNTWFFLANVPENFDALQEKTEYPKGLKIFTQYILLPLVGIYFVILYAYAAKIIIEWNWPQGWVSVLILGFSISGILALLFIYPVKERSENVWIRTLWKLYFFILIPLDVMLILAIWKRITEYGITESRYIVIVLAIWLCGITLYFIVSKGKSIKIIPASLCLIAFLITVGPWSAFTISTQSQLQRLEKLLVNNSILIDGKVVKSKTEVPFDDARDISSVVDYICDVHGSDILQPWFTTTLDTIKNASPQKYRNSYEQSRRILNLMGVRYIGRWQKSPDSTYMFSANEINSYDVTGYQHLLTLTSYSYRTLTDTFKTENETYIINADSTNTILNIQARGVHQTATTIDLTPFSQSLLDKYKTSLPEWQHIPSNDMIFETASGTMHLKFLFSQLHIRKDQAGMRIKQMQGNLLIRYSENGSSR